MEYTCKVIAKIYTDYKEKFGIPRQSGLAEHAIGRIVFEPEFRSPDAVRGLNGFNYIWLLWAFEGTARSGFNPVVRPPRLGGNTSVGVFASRSPFRPNPIGLSSVRLTRIAFEKEGPVLYVTGADLRNETPIYDIKPYLPYADCHQDARDGFAELNRDYKVKVVFEEALLQRLPETKREAAIEMLSQDPRPAYQEDADRVYGVRFADVNIRFQVKEDVLTVIEVQD